MFTEFLDPRKVIVDDLTMHTGLKRLGRAMGLCSFLALTACPTVVPPPSSVISSSPTPLSPIALKNMAPRQEFASFVPRFADVDGDGHLDLLLGSKKSGEGFRVARGDGEGHWRLQKGPASNIQPRAISVADVDRNGRADILIGGEGEQHGLQIWSVDDGGRWRLQAEPAGEGVFHGLVLHDINGDGWPDIVAARMGEETSGGVLAWLNDRHGGWLPGYGPTVRGHFADVAVADVNGDGNADIVAAERGGFGAMRTRGDRYREVGGVRLWLGDGSGRWTSRMLPVEGDAESVAVADINGDGRSDILAGLFRLGVRAWLNDGDGWNVEEIVNDGSWGALRVADIDDDGALEVMAASRDGRGIGVWRPGRGFLSGGGFDAVHGLLPAHGIYFGIDVGRLYGKGGIQVASARRDGRVEVWSARMPARIADGNAARSGNSGALEHAKSRDLFHVSENKVFKTVHGVIEYRIGPGDTVAVVLWQGGKASKYSVKVRPDGAISMPYFESAHIAGMTASEADDFLTRKLSRFLRHPRVDVGVEIKHSKRVRVFGIGRGLKSSPSGGVIYLTGRETLVDLLSSLGAPARNADFSRIRLVRNGKTTVLNVQRAIRQSDESQNAVLDDGDTVVIPSLDETQRKVFVLGEVKHPGVVTFRGEFHLLEAVLKSGGFTQDAYFPDIRVIRADREAPQVFAVAFERLMKRGDLSQDLRLRDKDIIIIPADPIANWNRFVRKLLPTVSNISSTITEVNALKTLLRNSTGSNVIINTGGGL